MSLSLRHRALPAALAFAISTAAAIGPIDRASAQGSTSRNDNRVQPPAEAAPLPEVELDDLVTGDRTAFLVALDGVTDPGNLGAVLRSAECAGVNGVILPRHRATHVTPAVTKAAGFAPAAPIIEIRGLCARCRGKA